VHYRQIAKEIAALVPGPDARLLDYGSGEALHADIIAAAAGEYVDYATQQRTPKLSASAPRRRIASECNDFIGA
jgi:hypothetical protein